MANKLGMNQSNYGRLERGQTEISTNRLFQIAEILQADPFTLFEGGIQRVLESQRDLTKSADTKSEASERFSLQRTIASLEGTIRRQEDHIVTLKRLADIAVEMRENYPKVLKDKDRIIRFCESWLIMSLHVIQKVSRHKDFSTDSDFSLGMKEMAEGIKELLNELEKDRAFMEKLDKGYQAEVDSEIGTTERFEKIRAFIEPDKPEK